MKVNLSKITISDAFGYYEDVNNFVSIYYKNKYVTDTVYDSTISSIISMVEKYLKEKE